MRASVPPPLQTVVASGMGSPPGTPTTSGGSHVSSMPSLLPKNVTQRAWLSWETESAPLHIVRSSTGSSMTSFRTNHLQPSRWRTVA